MESLTPQARRVLSNLKQQLAPGQRKLVKFTPAWQRVYAWAIERDLMSAADNNGRQLSVSYALLQQFDKQLQLEGEAPLSAALSKSSLEQAALGATEYKSIRQAPREQRVLMACPVREDQTQWSSGGWEFRDIDIRVLEAQLWSHLVVVENLDCFYELARFELALSARMLILYRGDKMYGKGLKRLRAQAWVKAIPNYYFGDLDLAGIRIASSEGFHAMAAPSFAWFTQQAQPADYTSVQHKFLARLGPLGDVQPYLEFMARHQRALKQQKLQAVQLFWRALQT